VCQSYTGQSFFPLQNDSRDMHYETDSKPCMFRYVAGGMLTFTSANIISKPQNGSLEQTQQFTFRYTPKKGFKGTDTMILKTCGSTHSGSGCSTLTYKVKVY
jgi:Bacterial Ig domain